MEDKWLIEISDQVRRIKNAGPFPTIKLAEEYLIGEDFRRSIGGGWEKRGSFIIKFFGGSTMAKDLIAYITILSDPNQISFSKF